MNVVCVHLAERDPASVQKSGDSQLVCSRGKPFVLAGVAWVCGAWPGGQGQVAALAEARALEWAMRGGFGWVL